MNTNRSLLVVFATAIAVMAVIIAPAFAEEVDHYANAFPSVAYYEEKQERAREHAFPQPKQYDEFWINPLPEQVTCDTWLQVSGHVHWGGGQLEYELQRWGGDKDFEEDGRFWLQYIYKGNLSYSTQYELQNYVYIPCHDAGEHEIVFVFTEHPRIDQRWNRGDTVSQVFKIEVVVP